MPDFDKNIQREIESELFEKYDLNFDRNISLIKLLFIMLGLYVTLFEYFGKGNTKSAIELATIMMNSVGNDQSLSILNCVMYIILAFFVLFQQCLVIRYKFKVVGKSVQYREGSELEIGNMEMYRIIKDQDQAYVFSILLSAFSFFCFLGYFSPDLSYTYENLFQMGWMILLLFGFMFTVVGLLSYLLHKLLPQKQ